MPFEILSVESRIEARLADIRSNASFLSALDGQISQTRLNQALRGHRRLENAVGTRLNALTLKLVELRDALAPLPVSFTNPDEVRRLLEITKSSEEIRALVGSLFQ